MSGAKAQMHKEAKAKGFYITEGKVIPYTVVFHNFAE
jgi:hypothetical protein